MKLKKYDEFLILEKFDDNIKAEEVYQMFDSVQMHILKENIEKNCSKNIESELDI
jgi:hypothetical protein